MCFPCVEKIRHIQLGLVVGPDKEKLLDNNFEEMTDDIIKNISLTLWNHNIDRAWFMGTTKGIFTIKSAWELVRHKQKKGKIMTTLG